MKILKLLNKKNLSIIIFFLLPYTFAIAEDKPIDIWNLDKQKLETTSETISLDEKKEPIKETSIYDMQDNKNKNLIKLINN